MAAAPAPRTFPTLRRGAAVVMLCVAALMAWVFWMAAAMAGKEEARSKLSFEERSGVPVRDLLHCLDDKQVAGLGIRRKGATWQTRADTPNVHRAENGIRHLRIEVVEAGDARILRLYTRDGMPPYRSDRALIEACLADRGT